MTASSFGFGKLNPSGAKDVVELNAVGCCVGHPPWASFESRDADGVCTDRLSESCRFGTAVREELSEEKRLDPLVADDAVDLMLAPSNDLLCPESVVDVES